MIVAVVLKPIWWAVRITSSHRPVSILSGHRYRPHFIIQNLCRSARQRAKTGGFQRREELADRDAERRRALVHFERRERVHVHAGHGLANRRADVEIGLAREARLDAALHAHFSRAALPGFARAPGDLVERQRVGPCRAGSRSTCPLRRRRTDT